MPDIALRRVAAALVAATLAGVVLLVGAAPAVAHNTLVGSTPAAGSTVTTPVSEVVLEFDQAVQTDFAQVAVLGTDQAEFQTSEPTVVGRTVTQAVSALPDGAYTVSYRVISADGHPVAGTVAFTADGQAAGATAPEPVAAAGEPAAESSDAASTGAADGGATAEQATPEASPDASPQASVAEDDGGLSPGALVAIGVAVAAGVGAAAYAATRRRPGGTAGPGESDTGP